jgi:hypothetical protein
VLDAIGLGAWRGLRFAALSSGAVRCRFDGDLGSWRAAFSL